MIGGCATTYQLLFRGINSFHYDIPVINRECFVVRIFKSGTRKRPILQRDLLLHVFEKRSYIRSSIMLSAFLRDVDCQSSRAVMNYNKLFRERKGGTAGVDSNKRDARLVELFFLL